MKKIQGILLISLAVISAGKIGTAPAQDAANPAAPADKSHADKDNPLLLTKDAPTMYTVVKGDTLWDISVRWWRAGRGGGVWLNRWCSG